MNRIPTVFAAVLGAACWASPASAELLGISPSFPVATCDGEGTTTYDAATDTLSIDVQPEIMRLAVDTPPCPIGDSDLGERSLTLNVVIDADGTLVGGVDGDDFVMVGAIDEDNDGVNEFEGVLLTAEIQLYGFHVGGAMGATWTGGAGMEGDLLGGETGESRPDDHTLLSPFFGRTALFDFRLVPTGGEMMGLFVDQSVGVTLTSTRTLFNGDFRASFAGGAEAAAGAIDPIGACCFEDGRCSLFTEEECIDQGGEYQGDNNFCQVGLCEGKGACCFDDGSCGVYRELLCGIFGGAFLGRDTVCFPGLCAKGACCLDDGSCVIVREDECEAAGGDYKGDNTTCEPGLCDPEGACCFEGGACEILTRDDCEDAGGLYQGNETECDPGLCPETKGACCFDDGACAVLTEGECVELGGDYLGDETICEPGLCARDGACCFDDGSCEVTTQADCQAAGGAYQGNNTLCDPGLCPETKGACCFDDGDCAVMTEEECIAMGGDYQGDDTICEPDTCPQPGACCLPDLTCIEGVLESECDDQGGIFHEGATCAEVDCPRACCFNDGSCLILTAEECAAEGGVPQEEGVDCDPGVCPQEGACCLPDTDCSTGEFDCDGKVVFMTLIWDGVGPVNVTAYDGDVGGPVVGQFDNVQPGDAITVGPLAGPNDSYWEIFDANTGDLIGLSKFHRSCSDNEMNGPEDCGNREGNGKSNESGLINDWILEGLVDEAGNSFDCGLSGGGSENCQVLNEADCLAAGGTFNGNGTSCDDVDCQEPTGACCIDNSCLDLTEYCCGQAGGLYLGDGTSCATDLCFDCDGKVVEMTMIWDGAGPVNVTAYDGDTDDPVIGQFDNVQVGDAITVGPLDGPNDSYWEIFDAGTGDLIGLSKFHRSCSDDEMNGPEDCGNREGNGKSNESGFINDWILEGLVDEAGAILDCSGDGSPLLFESGHGSSVGDVEEHVADVNQDGRVDSQDLIAIMSAWGACPASCPADVDHNRVVDELDLMAVLARIN